MQFTREINRLLLGLLLAFSVVGISASYWAAIGPDTLLLREDNPRLVDAEASILRGDIVDRDGAVLVTSGRSDDGAALRQYLFPETHGALGYFSLRYGVGGAEAAYDEILRGDDLPHDLSTYWIHDILHQPQEGSDIQLSYDLDVQTQVIAAMNGETGAAVVLAVPSGEILAMVSLPTYDPNTLDENWERLTAAPGNPFFNRVLQGNYQPGATLQTPLMAAALLANQSLNTSYENAAASVHVADANLSCSVRLPRMALSLRDAYAFACPSPFVELIGQIDPHLVETTFVTFRLSQPPTLPGFVVIPDAELPPEATPATIGGDNLVRDALGQGDLTVSPLGMATMVAAIVNDGNAPQPYTLLQIRRPGERQWSPVQELRSSIPVATMNTARQLQDLMRNAVANGAAQNAGRPNIDIGGHAALAYSGEGSQAWFIGFATLGGRRGIAVAVVLEDSDDPGLAADIGGTALAAAHEAMQNGSFP